MVEINLLDADDAELLNKKIRLIFTLHTHTHTRTYKNNKKLVITVIYQ